MYILSILLDFIGYAYNIGFNLHISHYTIRMRLTKPLPFLEVEFDYNERLKLIQFVKEERST